MATQTCTVCADILHADDRERGICTLCLHRTSAAERTTRSHKLTSLIDAA